MKKTLQLAAIAMLMYSVISCTDSSLKTPQQNTENALSQARENADKLRCASMEVLEENLKEDPKLKDKMREVEEFTERFIKNKKKGRVAIDQELIIPVQVNILYRTNAENITLEQVQSQIDVLNEDFSGTNTDLVAYNGTFKTLAANYKIKFVLQLPIIRKATTKSSWGTRDAMKNAKKGGINPSNPTNTLNMWVCTIGGGILGYAQFPGGNINTDGVVMDSKYFGRIGTATAPYHKGRTATHEVGHWLNLRHIWGDATCGSDQVDDTPTHNIANYGCPALDNHRSTCTNTPIEMTQNYMDYTDDACMFMFTNGQRMRSRAIFDAGGARATFNP
jgi:hypothetical protein